MLWLWMMACEPDGGPPPCEGETDGAIQLPDDDGPHGELVETWTWTGHLQDEDGARVGYSLAFTWRGGTLDVAASVSDLAGEQFHHQTDAVSWSGSTDGTIALAVGDQSATGADGLDTLVLSVPGYTLDLVLEGAKPAAIHHGDGHTTYAVGGEAWSYSRTRMLTTGTLGDGPESREVTGLSWFDHEWGDLTAVAEAGVERFSLTLDDGFEILLIDVLDGTEGVSGGSWVDPGCGVVEVATSAARITPIDTWTSQWTGCTYPQTWTVQLLDDLYTVTPEFADQEVGGGTDVGHWQGVATVVGPITGRAAVSLTGYCD